jgi:hypothetical protein
MPRAHETTAGSIARTSSHPLSRANFLTSPVKHSAPRNQPVTPNGGARLGDVPGEDPMICPRCQNEFPDSHFYCPHCRTQVQDYLPEELNWQPTKLQRVGRVMLDVLVLVFFVGAGVLLWRAIKWQDLFEQVRPAIEIGAPAAGQRSPRPQPTVKRSASPKQSNQPSSAPTTGTESLRQTPQKIEEPPRSAADSKPTPTSTTTIMQPASQSSTAPDQAALSVAPPDMHQGSAAGFVAINSRVPAHIYVDGQFSGVTPRTVRLAAGSHQIRLIAEGYEDWTRRVQIKSRQQLGVTASLKKKADQ